MSTAVAESVSLEQLKSALPAWRELCARAAEPNLFVDPDFLLPLLAYEAPRGLALTLVRSETGGLIGMAALTLPRLGVGLARVWRSPYAALPACVFDREAITPALRAILALLRARTRLQGVVWPLAESGGALAHALRAAAAADQLPLAVHAPTRRSALRISGALAFEASLNPRRRKRWARQARRLSERGRIGEVLGLEALEAFFAVERRGWKGARGTALADDPARLAFARDALGALARAGRLDALALTLDGAPIAAGLMLMAGRRGFYWKSAYDEAFAEASPGVQLALAQSRRLAATPGLDLLDSCAIEDHPMIGRLWSDWLHFEDVAVGLRPGGDRPMRIWLGLSRAQAWARGRLKRLVYRALGRKLT